MFALMPGIENSRDKATPTVNIILLKNKQNEIKTKNQT